MLLSPRIVLGSRLLLVMSVLAVAGLASPGRAQIVDPIAKGSIRIDLETVASGLAAPNYLTSAPGDADRLFVVDQNGLLRIIKNGSLSPTPFLDVSSRMPELGVFGSHDENDFDERGLLGVAFHPEFNTPGAAGYGKLYTFHSETVTQAADFTTAAPPPIGEEFSCQNVIAEWTVDPSDPDRVVFSSRRELLRLDKPQFNHNAGAIVFGPDGLLYASIGDGGGADDQDGEPWFEGGGVTWGHGPDGNSQNQDVIYGKIIRIDPLGNNSANGQYGIPADNPFVGGAGLDEIYATGFRNPFRMGFDRLTGELITGDVGQNNIEEIDVVAKGGNYGWRVKEGTFLFDPNGSDPGFASVDSPGNPPQFIDPVAQYDHDDGLSVIGGFVYRGSLMPQLAGKYIFGDFSTDFATPDGRLFYADLGTGEIREFLLGDLDLPLGLFIKGFGEDSLGEIYLLAGTNLGPFGSDGVVLRIVPAPGALMLGVGALVMARRRR